MIGSTFGYVRSEKRTVEGLGRPAAAAAHTAATTAAKPLDNTRSGLTAVECRPSAATTVDGPGRCAHSYGSEGWVSSPSERVQVTGPLLLRGGSIFMRGELRWEPRWSVRAEQWLAHGR